MSKPVTIAMYADLACPYAYVSAYRLRKLREEYRGSVFISSLQFLAYYPGSFDQRAELAESDGAGKVFHAAIGGQNQTLWFYVVQGRADPPGYGLRRLYLHISQVQDAQNDGFTG